MVAIRIIILINNNVTHCNGNDGSSESNFDQNSNCSLNGNGSERNATHKLLSQILRCL